ncbi:hypothetical protein HYW20_08260 [Candidatus Woesearchaeota archaeon]|nr:hypothetical protein [Candidatus Woesearchaeota archaeon]
MGILPIIKNQSKVINIKLDLEKIFLVIFLAILLFIGPGALFGHQIKHDFPYNYLSSDAFQHQVRAESIKDAGNFRYEANYISLGLDNIIGRYPPVLYHLAVILSYAAGIETYDSIYFIVYFFVIASVFAMYLIIRRFSKNIAIIALPLTILAISPNLYVNQNGSLIKSNFGVNIGFAYGHWPSLLAQSFLIAFAWWLLNSDLKKSYIPTAIILSAVALSHTSEAIFAILFLLMFLIMKWISKNLKKNDIKDLIFSLAIAFALSVYFLIIFLNTWAKSETYSFVVEPVWQGNPGVYIMSFGVLLAFIIAGIVFSLFKFKNMHISLVFGFAMLFSGFLNYIGFSLRSFQIRFLWPIYLSVFFGFGIYMLLKLAIENWNIAYSVALAGIFIILLVGFVNIPFVPHYTKPNIDGGLMDTYHWSALKWLSASTEPNSRIYFFYGDIYGQDALLRNSKRVHYQVNNEDFVKSIQERKIKRYYVSESPGDSGGTIAARSGLFKFDYPANKKPDDYFFGQKDICSFNYIVLDKVSGQEAFWKYNMLLASEMLKKSHISKVFENEVVIILKNNKIGADCIEERSF